MTIKTDVDSQGGTPWWRVPMVWLVIAGPAAVVVAGLATLVIALNGADRPLRESPPAGHRITHQTPAALARNHVNDSVKR